MKKKHIAEKEELEVDDGDLLQNAGDGTRGTDRWGNIDNDREVERWR